jgi:hypothetical protein
VTGVQTCALPISSYHRYKRLAFKDEKEALLSLSVDFVLESIAESGRRYQQLFDRAIEITKDKSVDPQDKLSALSIAGELEKQRLFLIVDGPRKVSELRGFSKTIEKIEEKGRKKSQLRFVKSDKQLPTHFEITSNSNSNNRLRNRRKQKRNK